MPSSIRLNLRLPEAVANTLKSVAAASGYSSHCQLARCVLAQFVKHRWTLQDRQSELTDWMEDLAMEDMAMDPRNRKDINERL